MEGQLNRAINMISSDSAASTERLVNSKEVEKCNERAGN